MRRGDSVFFFTLIDFLLAALFFWVVLFALSRREASTAKGKEAQTSAVVDTLVRLAGVASVVELTDNLTRLGPIRDAVSAVAAIRQVGDLRDALRLIAAARTIGADSLESLLASRGAGKPHCIESSGQSGRRAVAIGRVVADDSTMTVVARTAQLDSLFRVVGTVPGNGVAMDFPAFRRLFTRVAALDTSCLYTLEYVERTRFVDARDAASGVVYLRRVPG